MTKEIENIGTTYENAGVNLKASELIKERIKLVAGQTYGPNVIGGVGGFGALYKFTAYKEPVLVSSTDPVGTKLMVAGMVGDFSRIGADLVNAGVNDIIVVGADPLFFLDYIATSRMVPETVEMIVDSIAEACSEVDCALIGGETAEMPGVFSGDNFDLSGFIVGAVELEDMLHPLDAIMPGDALIGIPSNGLHTNGYSLVRHVFRLDLDLTILNTYVDELGETLGEALLKPHPSYYHSLKPLFNVSKGIAHITGGGLYENVPRMLSEKVAAKLYPLNWNTPAIFKIIQNQGSIDIAEMYRVYNMGLGMVVACAPEHVSDFTSSIDNAIIVGEIVRAHDSTKQVELIDI